MLQEQWKMADFLYECGQLRWQNLRAYLVAPVQGDRQVQEADIPDLSADEFESLLDSSHIYCYSASEGLKADMDHARLFLEYATSFLVSLLARFVVDFPP
jgi:hypothetical protein